MPSPILSRRTLLAGTTLLAAPAILSRRSQRGGDNASSAPGAATMRGCCVRTSTTRS